LSTIPFANESWQEGGCGLFPVEIPVELPLSNGFGRIQGDFMPPERAATARRASGTGGSAWLATGIGSGSGLRSAMRLGA